MFTIKNIFEKAVQHPTGGGAKMSRFETPKLIISIVGGRVGLYGDFEKDFEVAIIDKTTNNFVSNFFYPELCDNSGDIMPFVPTEKVLKILDELVVL